jgi:hypothetical protein
MAAPTLLTEILIRFARPDDQHALTRLAGRDTQPVPDGELLVAEANGEIRAALPLDGRRPVADPFHPTTELVHLLEVRRGQLK